MDPRALRWVLNWEVGGTGIGGRNLASVSRYTWDDRVRDAAQDLLAAMRRIAFQPFGHAGAGPYMVLDEITTFARRIVAGVEGDSPADPNKLTPADLDRVSTLGGEG